MDSVLRQELDSLVRVVFVLAQRDRTYRHRLIEDSVSGRRWKEPTSKKVVTDREMVELTEGLHGWTKSVDAFGCAFIHLSSFHDHKTRDPLDQLSEAERTAILDHLRYYHGGPNGWPFHPEVYLDEGSLAECDAYLLWRRLRRRRLRRGAAQPAHRAHEVRSFGSSSRGTVPRDPLMITLMRVLPSLAAAPTPD